tara:strand:- start:371 stop:1369 length:999 start_codon:yes stop_codon:yes gene_type:complete
MVSDMDENEKIIKSKLDTSESKPLVNSPTQKISESTEISKIIKPVEKIVKSGKPIKDNKIVSDSDKVTSKKLSEILSTPVKRTKSVPTIISKDSLSEEDSIRLMNEESYRRAIENERRGDIQSALEDELKRREEFNKKIQSMKDEFNLYTKSTYPSIVKERFIKDGNEDNVKSQIEQTEESLKVSEARLQKNKVERLEREKLRKLSESELQINKLTSSELQAFLEDDILLEQKVKLKANPEIENLNFVQKTKRDISDLEISMGRKIIPHRDIIESNESDFDINAITNSDDILILTNRDVISDDYINKTNELEKLRLSLLDNDSEDDYILKYT